MILSIFFWRHLLNLGCGVDDTEDENGSSDIERIDNGVRHNALSRHIADAEESEKEGEYISHKRTGIAQETLDRVGEGLLLFVDHVAHKHLKRLHRHVDTCVEEHQRAESEGHSCADSHTKRTCIRQQAHHEHCHSRSYK